MSRFAKWIVYAVLTALLCGISVWAQAGPFTDPDPSAGFVRGVLVLFAVGIILLGTGLFLRKGTDALFFDIVGGITLLAGIILFLRFGGMEDATAVGGDTAINLLSCLWTALPAAFLIRALVIALSTRDDRRACRRIAGWVTAVLVAGFIALLVTGNMLRFVHNEKEEAEEREDIAWIEDAE